MFVLTRVELDWRTSHVLLRRGFEYTGPVALLKGASSAQTDIADQQKQFYQTMNQNYQTQFANQGQILKSLSTSFAPILAAGVNQFGFNPAETAALRTQASEGTANTYGQASRALGTAIASESGNTSKFSPVASGGETYIPSGQVGQAQEELAAKAAQQETNQQLGITTAGYAQGRQNYFDATKALGSVASEYNPTAYASTANTSGGDAFNSATEIQKINAAASPWSAVGGLLGGVAGSFLGPIGGALGSKVGSMIGGKGGSSGGGADFSDFSGDLG